MILVRRIGRTIAVIFIGIGRFHIRSPMDICDLFRAPCVVNYKGVTLTGSRFLMFIGNLSGACN